MAKRGAQSELNHLNWDAEEEQEEAGIFKLADKETMQSRQIIKAKRKSTSLKSEGSASFSGFSGFSFKPTTTSTPFNLNVKSVTNGKSSTTVKGDEDKAEVSDTKLRVTSNGSTAENKSQNNSNPPPKTDLDSSYSENLKKLNQSVLSWIQFHVGKNPYCILTPIFKDYETYLGKLEKDKDTVLADTSNEVKKADSATSCEENVTTSATPVQDTKAATTVSFSFGTSASTVDEGFKFGTGTSASTVDEGFKFGTSTLSTTADSASNGGTKPTFSGFGFSFKQNSSIGDEKPGFSFAVNKPPVASSSGASQGTEEEEYVPPQPESKEIVEEDSLHTIKCKLYYQKEGNWQERGVGFLYLKKANDKLQLLVRADTTLGNILLNISVPQEMPIRRQGKNNVSLMCVPNPPLNPKEEPKPTAMLIRVKTGEDADTLVEKIDEIRN